MFITMSNYGRRLRGLRSLKSSNHLNAGAGATIGAALSTVIYGGTAPASLGFHNKQGRRQLALRTVVCGVFAVKTAAPSHRRRRHVCIPPISAKQRP